MNTLAILAGFIFIALPIGTGLIYLYIDFKTSSRWMK